MVESPVQLSLFVVLPSVLRFRYILLLTLLTSAGEQNHQALSVFAQINPQSWPEIDSTLINSFANTLPLEKLP
jgi:hypothetical protein